MNERERRVPCNRAPTESMSQESKTTDINRTKKTHTHTHIFTTNLPISDSLAASWVRIEFFSLTQLWYMASPFFCFSVSPSMSFWCDSRTFSNRSVSSANYKDVQDGIKSIEKYSSGTRYVGWDWPVMQMQMQMHRMISQRRYVWKISRGRRE